MPGNLYIDVPEYILTFDKKAFRKVFKQAGSEIAAKARRKIRESQGGGRKYGNHTASAPGQAPVNLSGKLATSVRVKTSTSRNGMPSVTITDTAPYALSLEMGAAGGGGQANTNRSHKSQSLEQRVKAAIGKRVLQPRPFMEPALEEEKDDLVSRMQSAIMDGIEFRRQR